MSLRRSTPFLLLALLFSGAQTVAAQMTVADVLARHAKAVDPEGKLAALEGMKSTATMETAASLPNTPWWRMPV